MRIHPYLRCAGRLGLLPLICLSLRAAHAGSATWSANPTSNDWNTAANWMPHTVPNGPTDEATFAGSSITGLRFSGTMTEVAELVFNPGASSFNITADSKLANASVTLTISGAGLTNNSGVTQTLTAGPSKLGKGGTINFLNAATAGEETALTALGSVSEGAFNGSTINFYDTSTASTASIRAEGATGTLNAYGGQVSFYDKTTAANANFTATGAVSGGYGGTIYFFDSSTASNATFTLESGTGFGGQAWFADDASAEKAQFTVAGGEVNFFDNSTAANSTFTLDDGGSVFFDSFNQDKPTAGNGVFVINGASTSHGFGGAVAFSGGTAGNATFIANSGTNGGDGATINFFKDDESQALIQLFGNATLTVFFHSDGNGEVTVGSVEGDGLIVLSNDQKLLIGSNNLNTTFSGIIQDFGTGSLGKVGTGTLSLTGASTYDAGTTVTKGTLLATNLTGSATGTGAVSVNGGTLGGSGIIAGSVTVGTNTGVQAFLAPSKGVRKPATLTIQSPLTLNDDSTYIYKLDTKRSKADEVVANGVTIDSGAKFSLRPSGNNALTTGQVFTVISNTSASPIVGIFHNLEDGEVITVNGNNLQASYSGGDGNDLTLTVVP